VNFYSVGNIGDQVFWSTTPLDYTDYLELGSRNGSYVLVPILYFGPDFRVIDTLLGPALERGEFEPTKRILVRVNLKTTNLSLGLEEGVIFLTQGVEIQDINGIPTFFVDQLLLLEDGSSFYILLSNGEKQFFFAKDGELTSDLESQINRKALLDKFSELYHKKQFTVI